MAISPRCAILRLVRGGVDAVGLLEARCGVTDLRLTAANSSRVDQNSAGEEDNGTKANKSRLDQWDLELAERLRRACAPLTVREIAGRAHSHHETVRRLLSGLNRPSARFVAHLCAGLGFSTDILLLRGSTGDNQRLRLGLEAWSDESLRQELRRRIDAQLQRVRR